MGIRNFFGRVKYAYNLYKSEQDIINLAEELSSYQNCRVSFRIGKAYVNDNGDVDFEVSDDFGKDYERDFGHNYYFSGGIIKDSDFGFGNRYEFSIFTPGDGVNANGVYSSSSHTFSALSLDKVYVSEDEYGNPVFIVDFEDDNNDYQIVVHPGDDYVMW